MKPSKILLIKNGEVVVKDNVYNKSLFRQIALIPN